MTRAAGGVEGMESCSHEHCGHRILVWEQGQDQARQQASAKTLARGTAFVVFFLRIELGVLAGSKGAGRA